MCKPASDSLNATLLESHATRAHAMIIWRAMNAETGYTAKQAELLYKCNLDGVAEAFCVDHYPTRAFMLAAREDIVEAGAEPEAVKAVLNREALFACEPGDMILFAEGSDLGFDGALAKGKEIAKKIGSGVLTGTNGYAPYVLGGRKKAAQEAKTFVEQLKKAGAKTLVTTGPESHYAFTKLYSELGVELSVKVVTLTELLFAGKGAKGVEGKKVFFHDARAACGLGDTMPEEKVIMPDFFGPEKALGTGVVYESPREVLKKGGAEFTFLVWLRAMANAMGNDEALALTYPALAKKMAARRLGMIAQTGAEIVVTDSLATELYVETLDQSLLQGLSVRYLGDLA